MHLALLPPWESYEIVTFLAIVFAVAVIVLKVRRIRRVRNDPMNPFRVWIIAVCAYTVVTRVAIIYDIMPHSAGGVLFSEPIVICLLAAEIVHAMRNW